MEPNKNLEKYLNALKLELKEVKKQNEILKKEILKKEKLLEIIDKN